MVLWDDTERAAWVAVLQRVTGERERTTWGKETAKRPDVHVAHDIAEAMLIVDQLLDRRHELERLVSSAV